MDHPDAPETDPQPGTTPPAMPAAALSAVQQPPLGGAWVRQPDGTLVREAHTRDQPNTAEE